MHISSSSRLLDRRGFLRGTGVALVLPVLDAMTPVFGKGAKAPAAPRRMLGICNNLGLVPDRFFPTRAGRDYPLSPYLSELADLRDHFTVLSGVSHPGVDGSHASDVSFLTAAPDPGGGGFRNTVSLDQFIAAQLGRQTRFPSMTLGVNAKAGRRSLSWTESGVLIPCEDKASEVYRKLFLRGSEAEIDRRMRDLRLGKSIMDSVGEQSKSLQRRLGVGDRERLDQYLTAVRDVERRMGESEKWAQRPKPEAPVPMPEDPRSPGEYLEKTRLMYQMAKLAFETDSTRAITLLLDSNNTPTVALAEAEISDGYHNLSHHGKSESKLAQLEAIDRRHMRELGGLLKDLAATPESGGSLLEHTSVIYGSNLGDANKHTTDNLPVLVAGGGFRHAGHLAFDRERNTPLCNLFVSVLQQMGLERDRFASSTGTLSGLGIPG